MITLYLNHFRGFEDTFIPLTDVTFLVGENSTGKTSVLTALRVLCGHAAWVAGRFQVGDEVVGGFNDFASNGVGWFQLGYFRHEPAGEGRYDAALLTFRGSGASMPRVVDVRLRAGSDSVRFLDEQGAFFYSKRIVPGPFEESFQEWAGGDPLSTHGLSVLASDIQELRPSLMVSVLLTQEVTAYSRQMEELDQQRQALLDAQEEWLKQIRRGPPTPPPPINLPLTTPEVPRVLPTEMNWVDDLGWLAPIRAKPRRSYDAVAQPYSPEGDHIPWRLRSLSDRSKLREHLRAYGTGSRLYEDIETRKFGDTEDAPFELRVKLGDRTPNLINIGYGVSQVLPIVASVTDPSRPGKWFAIQQPEVHLHPRAQATLGEVFFDAALAPQSKRFLIETHSDYIVDRFRYRMRTAAEKGEPVPKAQVLFFERHGDKNVVHRMVLGPDGQYPEDQPEAFRAFFLQEELRNLGY
jgi:hypothetical protein